MKTDDISAIVARSPWFQGVADTGIDRLAEAAQIREFAVGSCIYSAGEPTKSIFCILSGRVRLFISSPLGHEFTVVDREPETWLAQQSLCGDDPRLLTAQVKEATAALAIPRNVVLEIGEEYPVMYRNLFQTEYINTRGLSQLMSGMLFYPLRVRLAGRLLELLNEHGQDMDSGVMLETRLSQNEFANLAMGSRQRVNKIFREWNERGILSMEGDHYLVTDIDSLRLELQMEEDQPMPHTKK